MKIFRLLDETVASEIKYTWLELMSHWALQKKNS